MPPAPTVAIPIEEPLLMTLIDAPLTPVPDTVVFPTQYVPVIPGVALVATTTAVPPVCRG